MRRVASLSGGVALAAGVLLVGPVSAAPAQRISDTEHILFCEELTAEGATALLVVGESEQFGSFADAAFWPPDAPPPMNPAWIAMDADVEIAGTSIGGTLLMVEFDPFGEDDPFGDPVGEATVDATLTPDGPPVEYRFNDGFGNQRIRREGTFQAHTVEGSLTMPNGVTFDLSTCSAFTDTYTEFRNMPAAFVGRFSSFQLNCVWETEIGFVGLHASGDEFGAFSDLFIDTGEAFYFGFPSGPTTLTPEEFEASYSIVDFQAGGEPVGSASASATLTPGGRINERFVDGPFKTRVFGQAYSVDGSLSLTLDGATTVLPMDESSCTAGDLTIMEHFSPRQGPKGR